MELLGNLVWMVMLETLDKLGNMVSPDLLDRPETLGLPDSPDNLEALVKKETTEPMAKVRTYFRINISF